MFDLPPLAPSESLTRFHSRAVPNISILDYLQRIIKWTKVEVRFQSSMTSVPSTLITPVEIMLTPHTTLHRPNVCPHAPLYPLLSHMSPLHYRFYHRLQQRPLRLLLHQRPLRPCGRHPCYGAQRPRARVSPRDRLALNGSPDLSVPFTPLTHFFFFCFACASVVHARGPPGILH